VTISSVASVFAPHDASAAKGANGVNGVFGASATNRAGPGDDAGVAASFAGLLASVLFPQAAPPVSAPQADGTSELDQQQLADASADATGSVGESKPEVKDAADPTNPALPTTTMPTIASTNEVVRSLAALDPALQSKLARVISRVEQETGHTVAVAETYRSQPRQDALYAQGRDTAGPVVTWTQNSKHTQGRAVDLVLDGGAAGSDAYRVLQRIANEEGLRTLGARDPGHVELPGNGKPLALTDASAMSVEPADASRPDVTAGASLSRVAQFAQATPVAHASQLAAVAQTPRMPQMPQMPQMLQMPRTDQLAQVAQVAQVPQAAQVARMAQVAKPGAAAVSGRTVDMTGQPVDAKGQPAQSLGAVRVALANGGKSGGSGAQTSSDRGNQSGNDSRNGYASLGANFSVHTTPSHIDAPQNAAPVSTAANHVENVMAAMDSAPARPLSQITMHVDAGNGTTDRIHVAMRGSSLSSTIDAADPRAAQAMSARSEELVRALNRDGIDVESLRVRAAAQQPSVGVTAATGAQTTQTSTDAQSHSRFDRGDAWQQQQEQQDRQDRQDRQQSQQRRQQRQQRGGQSE
jgi:hypothetical protein